jgi:hypothetical protein
MLRRPRTKPVREQEWHRRLHFQLRPLLPLQLHLQLALVLVAALMALPSCRHEATRSLHQIDLSGHWTGALREYCDIGEGDTPCDLDLTQTGKNLEGVFRNWCGSPDTLMAGHFDGDSLTLFNARDLPYGGFVYLRAKVSEDSLIGTWQSGARDTVYGNSDAAGTWYASRENRR